MTLTVIILLVLLGMFLLAIEILLLPGFVVGIIGGAIVIYAVYSAYVGYGTPMGHYVLMGTVLANILGVILLFRSNTWKKVSLNTAIGGKVNEVEEGKVKVGSAGVTVSRLTPMGKVELDGEVFEGRSTGEYIEAGEEIEVIKVDGNKIFVKSKK